MSAHAYRHRLTVRFRDCDAMGHVNHAVYFTYLEQCRLTCWREITGAPSPYTRVIIAHAECDYRAPAHFGDELEIGLAVAEIGRSSFTLTYKIKRPIGGQLIATGRTVMVAYDYNTSRSMVLPAKTRALLEKCKGSDPLQLDGAV
jgi:acyl-CoA thioester hydrolase